MTKRSFRLSDSKPDAKRDVDDELAFYLDMRTKELIEQGMAPDEARRAALAAFGDVQAIQSDLRDERASRNQEREKRDWWNGVWMDVKYGARLLRRSPVFTAVAVLSIAGGLTAGTAIFAFMNAVMYRPLGVGDGANLYRIFISDHSGRSFYSSASYPDYEAFREAKGVLPSICATERVRANVLVNGVSESHRGEIVSPGCFDALRLAPPSAGRYFSERQGGATASADPPPVVISHSLWVKRFASDPSVVGSTALLNGMSVAIVAVAPLRFAGTSLDAGAEFWAHADVAPVVLSPGVIRERRQRIFTIYARLADGIDRARAEAALAVVAAQQRRLDERAWADTTGATRKVSVMRETEARFAGVAGGGIEIVAGAMGSVALIVLIACLNLATMLLARGAARAREMSIRLAIGASRGRILRQLATESLMIAMIGTAAAIAAVTLGIRLFEANRPAVVPAFDFAMDWRVHAFAIALAIAATLLFGLAPAMHTLRLALAEGLKGGGHLFAARTTRLRVPAREALIVLQVAVSIALLLVSTLFVRAREDAAALSPGFNAANVAVVTAHLDAVPTKEHGAITARILQAAQTVKDVEYVSLAGVVPMSGSNIGFEVIAANAPARVFYGNVISPGYFATMEIPIRSGRDFDQRDREGGARVAIVGETFARSVWGTTNVVGKSLVKDGSHFEVVGVVADVRYRTISEPFLPLMYLPIDQVARWRFIIQARVRGGGETLAALDAAVRAVDGRVAIERARPMRARMEEAMAPERAAQWIGGIIGIVQLGLAVMALWGLVAYAVERRTAEMGVRLALGATPSSLARLTMRPAGVSILVGVAIGSVVGAIAAKVVQSESVGLAPLDLGAVIPIAAAFTIVAMAAAWWPARRAGMADPSASLRRE